MHTSEGDEMKFKNEFMCTIILLAFALSSFLLHAGGVFAQEPMIGQQDGTTWKNLVVGTTEESVTRKTFYVDGLYNMSAFWAQHAELKTDAVNYNDAFIGMNVGQIRDGLDSFYTDARNLHVPIVDAVLIVRLRNAHVAESRIESIVKAFREATINGIDPERENKIWHEALMLLR
jgi:hypothetical protein